jgi:hypothetical protein
MTEEMQILRDYHDSRPGPSPEVIAHARARLDDAALGRTRTVRQRRRRYVLGAAIVGAAAAVTVPLAALPGGEGDQAYAAERLPDGRIKVTIDDITGPRNIVQRRLDRLERRLATLGAKVQIDLIPAYHRCPVFPRGDFDRETNQRTSALIIGGDLYPGENTSLFYLRPDRIKPGNTLVWELSVNTTNKLSSVATRVYQVRSPVEPCNPVPIPGKPPG